MFLLYHLWLIPALPLAGAAINGIFGRRWPHKAINGVALGSTALSFVSVLELFREFRALPAASVPWIRSYFPWIAAGDFRADFALQIDQLTIVMLLVVTGVGFLIHIYSTGYMAHDGGYARFFTYLNLFMFFMLTLVSAANYLLLFVGWEGVGLCSYLLVGFWFLKKSATDAGNKAFWVNRVGDFGFLLGMFLIFRTFATLDFTRVLPAAANSPADAPGQFGTLTWIALCLLVGACGKSAQLPLYIWLPDAMEGPTPVSALIHAATMVTAGVYVVARSSAIFIHSPVALTFVALIGCATAFFAATIGLVQTDIKKVLAYSTVSQLGYMFLACGVGAFSAGIFHLMTHAFFKALLFLAAGSVIHAMGDEQDMRKMGGLRKKIPITFWTMLIATLAITGVPGFSGFFSKDAILSATYLSPYGGKVLWAFGAITVLLTSFYMFRLIFLTFYGKPQYDEHKVHVHESPRNMTIPLIILAILSIIGGWQAAPALWGGENQFEKFLAPVFAAAGATLEPGAPAMDTRTTEQQLTIAAFALAAIGFFVAWWLVLRSKDARQKLATSLSALYKLLVGKYFIDDFYRAVIVRPLLWTSRNILWRGIDESVIDGTVNGVARVTRETGETLRYVESGNTRSYASWIVFGAVVLTFALLFLAVRG